jgi:hypothetical protein
LQAACRIAVLGTFAFFVSAAPAAAEFSITEFSASSTSSQAGAHPDLTTKVAIPTGADGYGDIRDLVVQLPPGLQGAPDAGPRCPHSEFVLRICPFDTQIGWIDVSFGPLAGELKLGFPVYNVQPSSEDVSAELAFSLGTLNSFLPIAVRSDGNYGINVSSIGISRYPPIEAIVLTIWGVPGDPSHDSQRVNDNGGPVSPGPLPRIPFFTNPTSCGGELTLHAEATTYQQPEQAVEATATLPPITGCDKLRFAPTLKARPTTGVTDSPSGLDLDVGAPQNLEPDELATAQLRDATLTLPEGLVVNPSAADGLEACTPEQVGLKSAVGDAAPRFGLEPPNCPPASSLGTVELDTPAFKEPLEGTVYLATPHRNPFGSLLALYLVIHGHGLGITLAGQVEADSQTGRLTATFPENPQLPFEHLKLHLFNGVFAPLRTPMLCGTYASTSSLTPWSAPESGPPATPRNEYAIDRAPGGGSCPRSQGELPSSASLEAGSTAPIAGAFRPFVVNLSREDGTLPFGGFTFTTPPGLLAKLAGVGSCPDLALAMAAGRAGEAEEALPSCPAGSRVGEVLVRAGAGPRPFSAPGTAYLAGPYKGAPFSLAIVVPAVAGPFDLGTVVVRSALYFDPATAQITARSDPIPSILDGIPLDVRSVSIRLDRPNFTLNPTSCDPSSVGATLLTSSGTMAALASHFQVGECRRLAFKPKLALRLSGPTHRSAHPAMKATLTMPARGANVRNAAIVLPKTELLESAHIRGVCARAEYAANQCPRSSVFGYARVWSPLLDRPLEGPVYLRSSNHRLPDAVASLDGQIHLNLPAQIDSVNRRIRITFWALPDAPVSKLILSLPGGSRGLLVNNTQLCRAEPRVSADFIGQNDKRTGSNPLVKLDCGKK